MFRRKVCTAFLSIARVLSTLDQAPAVQASEALSKLNFAASQVRVPQAIANFGPQDRVARVTRGPAGNFVELYRAPTTPIGTNASGALVQILFVPFANGAETSILILSQGGTPLSAVPTPLTPC